jgi:hypothetical protein
MYCTVEKPCWLSGAELSFCHNCLFCLCIVDFYCCISLCSLLCM